MAKAWSLIDTDIGILLGDEEKTSYSAELRITAFNRACEYFAVTHTGIYKNVTASASAYAEGATITLPEDLVELPSGGIVDLTSNSYLEPVNIGPGDPVPSYGYTLFEDSVYLFDPDITDIRVWYYAGFTPIVDEDSISNLPKWSEWAVINLAIAYMLMPEMTSQQTLRQFQTRREAGSPEDSPPRQQAMFHIRLYNDIVGHVQAQNRTLLFRPN
jgi:hypothetical protein